MLLIVVETACESGLMPITVGALVVGEVAWKLTVATVVGAWIALAGSEPVDRTIDIVQVVPVH